MDVYGIEIDSPEDTRCKLTDTERKYTTARSGEVLALHRTVAEKVSFVDSSHYSFNWDISQNVLYIFRKDPSASGRFGTTLRSHIYCNRLLNRPRVGLEHLLAQGFPRWIRVQQLHDCEVRG